MIKRIFIDGKAGTTGLKIFERLESYRDIYIITLSEEERKDPAARKRALNFSDVAFLCLPDDAAREAVGLINNPNTVVIDTSTAHRTKPGWAYGFPELSNTFEASVASSKRIAVPGCHASGFVALVYPLIEAGFLSREALLSCFSLTGYSGGGKKMIAEYESPELSPLFEAPRQYGLSQEHKHLNEMQVITELASAPIFCPIVAPYYSGMEVTVPLFRSFLKKGADECGVRKLYAEKYQGPIVSYCDSKSENGFLSAAALSGTDRMEISVFGNEERLLLTARFDNLGKGASGAAVEDLNIVLGREKTEGLII